MRHLLLLLTLLLVATAGAATIHVPADQPTIQAGIDLAALSDTVVVAPGTYNESLVITRGVCLQSESGPEVTIVHPASSGKRVLSATGSNLEIVTISGFTLRGAVAVDNAIRIQNIKCNLENNWITDNVQCDNVVIYSVYCKVIGNRIWNNSGPNCSGLWIGGGSNNEVADNEIFSNSSSACSGIRTEGGIGPSIMHRNLIYNNGSTSSSYAAVLNVNGSWRVYNNTIVSNHSSMPTAAVWAGGSVVDIRNNIIASNVNCSGIRGASLPSYNDSWNNGFADFEYSSLGSGNFSENPLFLDELTGDYELALGSPCIDSGDPAEEFNDEDGTRGDIGALPSRGRSFPIATGINYGDASGSTTIKTPEPTIYWSYYDTAATDQHQFEIEVGTDRDWAAAEMWQSGAMVESDTSVLYAGIALADHTQYFLRLRVNNGVQWGEWTASSFRTKLTNTLQVPQERATIQQAIDESEIGDTVLVGPGTYNESLLINKAICLISSDGPAVTIIHPAAASKRILDAIGGGIQELVISGFTLSGATNTDYAVNINGFNCSVINNFLTDNQQCTNLTASNAAVKILSNRIWNNKGGNCSGIWILNGSDMEIAYNEIFDNSDSYCSGIRTETGTNSSIHHNLLYGNSSMNTGYAIALNINGRWNVYNNTVVSNFSTVPTAAVWLGGNEINFTNNIVVSNQNCHGLRSAYLPSYNDVWDNDLGDFRDCVLGVGNFSLNPLFVDPLTDDYHLGAGSPCINSGNPASSYSDPDGSRSDLGVYAAGSFDLPIAYGINYGGGPGTYVVNTLNPTFYWSFVDIPGSTQSQVEIEVGLDEDWTMAEIWQPGAISTQDTSMQYSGPLLVDHLHYYLRMRLNNGTNWGSWIPASFLVHATGTILVPQELGTIQAGIDAASAGDTVLVSAGTYTGNLEITKPLTLISRSGRDSTAIVSLASGIPLLRYTTPSEDSLIVVGFSFSGSAQAECAVCLSSGLYRFENNRILDNQSQITLRAYRSRGIVRGNRIDQNVGSECGGIAVQSDSFTVIEDNLIEANQSLRCAGIRTEAGSRGVIRRNVFRGNTSGSTYEASAVNINGEWKIYNNTLAYNSSSVSTAALWVGSQSADLRNNIVAFNSGSYGIRGAYNAAFNCSFDNQYEAFQDVTFGLGNITSDPLFVNPVGGDLSLQESSPCRDAGDPAGVFLDPDSTRNDMGAIAFTAATRLVGVRFVNEPDLEHILNNLPIVVWELRSSGGSPQTEFEIEYGTDDDWSFAELWDPYPTLSSDSSVAYAGFPLYDGERYWMRVRARNSSGWTNWAELPFRLNSPPAMPTLYYPEDGVLLSSLVTTLGVVNTTDGQGDSLYYVFEISLDSLFVSQGSTITVAATLPSYYTAVTTDSLLENGHYYWRVTASDYRDSSLPSLKREFSVNTANSAPPAFGLASPANGFDNPIGTRLPLLRWEPALDPDPGDVLTYTLYLALDANFHFVYVVPEITGTEFPISDPLEWNEHYWWKVKVADKLGVEAWCSQVFKFKTMTPGDANADGAISISDAILLINFIFAGGRAPNPLPSGDANCSGGVTISDVVYLIKYIFAGGPAPCEPDLLLKGVDRTPIKFGRAAPMQSLGPVN